MDGTGSALYRICTDGAAAAADYRAPFNPSPAFLAQLHFSLLSGNVTWIIPYFLRRAKTCRSWHVLPGI